MVSDPLGDADVVSTAHAPAHAGPTGSAGAGTTARTIVDLKESPPPLPAEAALRSAAAAAPRSAAAPKLPQVDAAPQSAAKSRIAELDVRLSGARRRTSAITSPGSSRATTSGPRTPGPAKSASAPATRRRRRSCPSRRPSCGRTCSSGASGTTALPRCCRHEATPRRGRF
ncbi:hypothetical protein M885DRAFT_550227 [Pelagophyceae sp. CCMP2097]|nr:hypothetical protein M885DRAFT_550227 [Pelagophyceae sp. CCMP2097]